MFAQQSTSDAGMPCASTPTCPVSPAGPTKDITYRIKGAGMQLQRPGGLDIAGAGFMKLFECGIRAIVLSQGAGVRWLRDELESLKVKIPLSEGCMEQLVREADKAAWRALGSASPRKPYRTLLREQLVIQATMVQRWTSSDEKINPEDEIRQAFVRIARKYALPRPWKLSDTHAVESRQLRPQHWKWTASIDSRSAQL
jgi:hypothetical protein